ncbi:hypothetical protein PanWU01x14_021660 [Parasponia andersonii]|uniref:Uncharacterized protein n=1 Tax=Parasponia andersonii TaxID=3476 RepID=A0A2P5DY13_PARAD|nr:hypothetical protein PanWU01x14_021660 [Parasponia andersonii]
MWDFTIPPLKGSASPLTFDSGTGSDTICNSPRIPLADIVRFATWTKPPSAAHDFQNASDRERYPHPYKECFVPPLVDTVRFVTWPTRLSG